MMCVVPVPRTHKALEAPRNDACVPSLDQQGPFEDVLRKVVCWALARGPL